MKLNFWQWLGVIILAIAVPLYIYFNFIRKPDTAVTPETNTSVPGTAAPDAGTPTSSDGAKPEANPTDKPAN